METPFNGSTPTPKLDEVDSRIMNHPNSSSNNDSSEGDSIEIGNLLSSPHISNPDHFSIELPHLSHVISTFSHALIQVSMMHLWSSEIEDLDYVEFERRVCYLVIEYARRTAQSRTTKAKRSQLREPKKNNHQRAVDVINLIHINRKQVSQHMWEEIATLHHRSVVRPVPTHESTVDQNSASNPLGQQDADKLLYAEFLDQNILTTDSFKWFTRNLRSSLMYSFGPSMEYIRSFVGNNLDTKTSTTLFGPNCHHFARFGVYWPIQKYMQAQYGSLYPPLGSVMVFTGSSSCGYATTCSEYLRGLWPQEGNMNILPSTLDAALRAPGKLQAETSTENGKHKPQILVNSMALYHIYAPRSLTHLTQRRLQG